MEQKTFLVNDPSNGNKGSRITADYMNHINEELSSILTDRGVTPDTNNSNQISKVLTSTFAAIASPTLTGIPQTSNPDGSIANQIATVDYVNQKALQATVGFTPAQQGGVTNMGNNKINIGQASDNSGVMIAVDGNNQGKIIFQSEDNNTVGITRLGYNTNIHQLGAEHGGSWYFYYDASDIDGKQFIQSTPDSSGIRITGIVWNTSSNLPQVTYNNGQVSYGATIDWVNNKGYVSGTSSMGSGDTAATGIHYTPAGDIVQLNLADSTTIGVATQNWVINKSYISTYSDSNTYSISEVGYDHNSDNLYFKTSNGSTLGATQSWTANNYLAKSGGTMTGDIAINGYSVGQGNGGSKITFETGGHISVWDNSNTCNWYWSQSDGNPPTVYSGVPIIANSYIKTNNPSSGENSNIVATTSWVNNKGYVSGTSSMGSGDTAASGIHYTPAGDIVQLNLVDSTTIGIATQNWVNGNFVANGTWDNNINQPVKNDSIPTFEGIIVNNIEFNNKSNYHIYYDSDNNSINIQTNNGSNHYNTFNADGSVNFGGNQLSCDTIISTGDIKTGSGKALYTNTISAYGASVNITSGAFISGDLTINGNASYKTHDTGDNSTHLASTAFVRNAISAGSGLNISQASPGYTTLPGGWIMQTGNQNTGDGGYYNINFPISFPNKCVSVFATEQSANGTWMTGSPSVYGVYGTSNTSCTVYGMGWINGNTWSGSTGINFGWIAIGY